MTHPALEALTLEEVRQRGAQARQMGLPFNSNPFYVDSDIPFDDWAAKYAAWSDGWVTQDAGRDKDLWQRMSLRFWF